jgi:hypothetical protein
MWTAGQTRRTDDVVRGFVELVHEESEVHIKHIFILPSTMTVFEKLRGGQFHSIPENRAVFAALDACVIAKGSDTVAALRALHCNKNPLVPI